MGDHSYARGGEGRGGREATTTSWVCLGLYLNSRATCVSNDHLDGWFPSPPLSPSLPPLCPAASQRTVLASASTCHISHFSSFPSSPPFPFSLSHLPFHILYLWQLRAQFVCHLSWLRAGQAEGRGRGSSRNPGKA